MEARYADVTERFRVAFHSLSSGQLIALPSFSLLESMSAVQLMDRKLDSGMTLMTCPALRDRELRPLRELGTEETLGLVDELVRRLAQWLEGESLVCTLLCCLYLNDPALYSDCPSLKSIFEVIFVLIDGVSFLTSKSTCLRDDDVAFNYCKVPREAKTPAEVLQGFKAAEREAEEHNPALLLRLSLFKGLLEVIEALRTPECEGLKEVEASLVAVEAGLQGIRTHSPSVTLENLFDPNFALRYVNSFPAHKIPISVTYTLPMALTRIEKVISSVRHIHALQNCKDIDELTTGLSALPSWDMLSRIAVDFQLYSPSEPTKVLGGKLLSELIAASMVKAGLELKTVQGSEQFSSFCNRVEIVFKDIIRLRLKNPTRQRRNLWKHFPDLSILLSDAEYAEPQRKKGKPPVLFNWIFKRLTGHMLEFLQFGGALELYNPGELGMVMFYQDYLLGMHISSLQSIADNLIVQKKSRKPKPDLAELGLCQAIQLLSRGLVRLFVILNKHNALPVLPADRLPILFQKRFRYFDCIQVPSKLDFAAYQSVSTMGEGTDDRYSAACQECFDAAKARLNALPQAPAGLVRVCIANSFAVTVGCKAQWQVKAELQYREHPYFPSIKLTHLV